MRPLAPDIDHAQMERMIDARAEARALLDAERTELIRALSRATSAARRYMEAAVDASEIGLRARPSVTLHDEIVELTGPLAEIEAGEWS